MLLQIRLWMTSSNHTEIIWNDYKLSAMGILAIRVSRSFLYSIQPKTAIIRTLK